MPEGIGTFAVWAHNRFLAYDRPNYFCKWGSPNSHITRYTPYSSFLHNWIFVLLYRPVDRYMILTAAEGR